MCGVVGILRYGKPIQKDEICRLTKAVAHRGPDGEGVWIHGDVALGHRRLAIIDPEHGQQPMSNHDGSLCLSYNGEIYNFKQLRGELEKRGYSFATQSDTEVVIHAYEEWGQSCVERFRGMFALAIVDLKRRRLFLARDHFGIKPLYYRITSDSFSFASELQALRLLETSAPIGDLGSVDYYLHYQYIPAPFTIYKDTFKLAPAHRMTVDLSRGSAKPKPERYWHLTAKPKRDLSDSDWKLLFKEAVSESVQAHMVADVPFGILVSGGIDSTLVAQCMSEVAESPLKAFSLGFSVPSSSEIEYARIAADTLGLDLTIDIADEGLFDSLPAIVQRCGEPFGDSSIMPSWYLAKMARAHVPMVLSGDGGDEAFAGYNSYQQWISLDQQDPLVFTDQPQCLLRRWENIIAYHNQQERQRLWRKEFHDLIAAGCTAFHEALNIADKSDSLRLVQSMDYHTYLPNDLLHKMDMASMSHGLEVRTPLTDIKVVELAACAPLDQRLRRKSGKWISKFLLKALLRGRFPDSFVYRPKKGFSIPRDQWLSPGSRGQELAEQVVLQNGLFKNWFSETEIKLIFDRRTKDRGHLWLLLVLGLWLDTNRDIQFV